MPATTRPIRLGVIGTGLALERLHWPALRQLPEQYTITAFAEASQEHATHFADYTGVGMGPITASSAISCAATTWTPC